jgi:hypothetical protein
MPKPFDEVVRQITELFEQLGRCQNPAERKEVLRLIRLALSEADSLLGLHEAEGPKQCSAS